MQLLSSNKLLMKKREPKSMLLGVPPAEGKPRKAFVALSSLFSTQRQQQIQLVSYQPLGQVAPVNSTAAVWNSTSQSDPPAPGAATGAEDCPVGLCSYEIIVNETVHLMKSFRLAGSAKEWLLVAGKRLLPEGGAGGASGLQFSIYSTTQENRNVRRPHLLAPASTTSTPLVSRSRQVLACLLCAERFSGPWRRAGEAGGPNHGRVRRERGVLRRCRGAPPRRRRRSLPCVARCPRCCLAEHRGGTRLSFAQRWSLRRGVRVGALERRPNRG